jgi:Thoeris protein ThsB, TIR-like domain
VTRRVFFSFHYIPDNWRAAQVRNMGVIEGNAPASDNDWESITRGGDTAIRSWIDGQMKGKSCAVILIGSNTAGRKWIKYEIKKAWTDGKGLLGINVHNLKDSAGKQSPQGRNPFEDFTISGRSLATIVYAYNPPYSNSQDVYRYINTRLDAWVEEAIAIRDSY